MPCVSGALPFPIIAHEEDRTGMAASDSQFESVSQVILYQ